MGRHEGVPSALCAVTGVPDDPDHWSVVGLLEAALAKRTAIAWSHALDDAGVPNEVAIDVKGGELALADADAQRLGMVVAYDHPTVGQLRQFGQLINFSETPGRVFGPPPRVGEDTLAILAELGRADQAADLRAAGVTFWPDADYPWTW